MYDITFTVVACGDLDAEAVVEHVGAKDVWRAVVEFARRHEGEDLRVLAVFQGRHSNLMAKEEWVADVNQ